MLREGCVTLERRWLWIDAWTLEHLVSEIDGITRSAQARDPERVERLGERVLALCGGAALAAEADEAWCVQPRERLRSRFVRAMTSVGRYWEEAGGSGTARSPATSAAARRLPPWASSPQQKPSASRPASAGLLYRSIIFKRSVSDG